MKTPQLYPIKDTTQGGQGSRPSLAQQIYNVQPLLVANPPPVRIEPDLHYSSEYLLPNEQPLKLDVQLRPNRPLGAFDYENVQRKTRFRSNK